ncbi:MAG: RNA polymerase sigma factor [Pseudomonadota bacterium]|nr:RNA polymerase sigma factor [Pseudomonadota bacterium]
MGEIEPGWTIVVEDVGPDLYRFFLGSFPAHAAADLVQETLIRLVQKHRDGEFDSSKGAIKNYAFGIAKFVRLEALKKKSNFDLVEDETQLDVPSVDNTNHADLVAHLRWAISQLKPIEQELILQMIDEESSFETIAEKFNMPVGTVKSHIHRAKEKLRQIMEVKT